MKLITRELLASQAAERWKQQYYTPNPSRRESSGPWKYIVNAISSQDIYEQLVKLGSSPDPDEVDRIIGNNGWTRVPKCTECEQDKQAVVHFDDPHHGGAEVCGECLIKALYAMEEVSV